MKFLEKISEKPWQQVGPADGAALIERMPQTPPARVALRFFLAVVSVLFLLITITFLSRSQVADFQALAGAPWQPLTDPSRLWVNTGLLLLSSIAIQVAAYSAVRDRAAPTAWVLGIATFTATLFLVGQLMVWRDLVALGYFVSSNPANSYFYLYTAIHGVHLLGGLIGLTLVARKVLAGGSIRSLGPGLSLCATYWHFLFALWLALFALMTSSPETYRFIAQLCGF